MTRPFGQLFDCPHCGKRSTLETEFSRWTRDNKLLESTAGFCIIDQDVWVHRFRTELGRDFQCLMLIEVKCREGKLTDAQKDTLYLVDQITRNRRETPAKELVRQVGMSSLKAFSFKAKRKVVLRSYGVHVLRFSGLGPRDSVWIRWDGRSIDEQILTKILRFDLDPDTLKPNDFRRHHASMQAMNPSLFDGEDW